VSRYTWDLIKESKRFYVTTYRRLGTILLVSVIMNLTMAIGLFLLYVNQPEHDFYATSGVVSPVQLTPLAEPNNTSVPLLEADAPQGNDNKVMPQ